jgi:hypothetical protein
MSAQRNGYRTAGGTRIPSGIEDHDGVVSVGDASHGGGGTVTVCVTVLVLVIVLMLVLTLGSVVVVVVVVVVVAVGSVIVVVVVCSVVVGGVSDDVPPVRSLTRLIVGGQGGG